MANSQPGPYSRVSDPRGRGPRAVTVCAFELLLFLLPENLGGSEQLWGALQRVDLHPLAEPGLGPLGRGFWQGEAVSWKPTRLVGPAEHLLARAGEFLLTASACWCALRPSGWLEYALSLTPQRAEGTDPGPGMGGLCCHPGSASCLKRGA